MVRTTGSFAYISYDDGVSWILTSMPTSSSLNPTDQTLPRPLSFNYSGGYATQGIGYRNQSIDNQGIVFLWGTGGWRASRDDFDA